MSKMPMVNFIAARQDITNEQELLSDNIVAWLKSIGCIAYMTKHFITVAVPTDDNVAFVEMTEYLMSQGFSSYVWLENSENPEGEND